MRRNFTSWLVLAVLSTSLLAFAADPPPPPPPPPPDTSSGGGGDSAFKAHDALLDVSSKIRKPMLSFFAGLPYAGVWGCGGGCGGFPFGLGGRFYLPIVHNGFLPMVNDSFGIEFGADFNIYTDFGVAFFLPAEARWGFHLIPNVEAYGKLGFGLGAFFTNSFGTHFYGYGLAATGIIYHVTDAIALRAEIGYPAIKIGIGIAL